jgi:hypothetical protein
MALAKEVSCGGLNGKTPGKGDAVSKPVHAGEPIGVEFKPRSVFYLTFVPRVVYL